MQWPLRLHSPFLTLHSFLPSSILHRRDRGLAGGDSETVHSTQPRHSAWCTRQARPLPAWYRTALSPRRLVHGRPIPSLLGTQQACSLLCTWQSCPLSACYVAGLSPPCLVQDRPVPSCARSRPVSTVWASRARQGGRCAPSQKGASLAWHGCLRLAIPGAQPPKPNRQFPREPQPRLCAGCAARPDPLPGTGGAGPSPVTPQTPWPMPDEAGTELPERQGGDSQDPGQVTGTLCIPILPPQPTRGGERTYRGASQSAKMPSSLKS